LAGVHFVIAFCWLALLSALVDRAQRLLLRPRVWQAIDLVAGSALVAFGLRIWFARR
jgi:threonine/homoserine/homoserine lactone efflux protein